MCNISRACYMPHPYSSPRFCYPNTVYWISQMKLLNMQFSSGASYCLSPFSFTWWRAPQQILRTHHSLKAFSASLWWRWKMINFYKGENRQLGEKPVPMPLCPPQIPHGLTRDSTRASVVRGRPDSLLITDLLNYFYLQHTKVRTNECQLQRAKRSVRMFGCLGTEGSVLTCRRFALVSTTRFAETSYLHFIPYKRELRRQMQYSDLRSVMWVASSQVTVLWPGVLTYL
jgi:hypothetical protein